MKRQHTAVLLATAIGLMAGAAHASVSYTKDAQGYYQTSVIDNNAQLAFAGFNTLAAGEAQGYRLATSQEFLGLMSSAGYTVGTYAGQPYGSIASAAVEIPGVNNYFNFYTITNPERHETQLGWLASGEGIQLARLTDNYVPHSCQYGEPGYYQNYTTYCGGRADSTVTLEAVKPVGTTYTPSVMEFNTMSPYYGSGGGTRLAAGFIMAKAVPEPGSYALMGLGLCALALVRRKQTSQA
jgi:PEP-CTERM motif